MYNDNNYNNQNNNNGYQPDYSNPMNNQGFNDQNYNQGYDNQSYNQGYDNQSYNQGFDTQNYNQGVDNQNYNQGFEYQAGYNGQPAMYDQQQSYDNQAQGYGYDNQMGYQQQDYSDQMYNTGYDNQGYTSQTGYDSQPSSFMPQSSYDGQGQNFDSSDTQPNFQPPQSKSNFKTKPTDNSGTIFLIVFLVVCGAIGFGIYKLWPQINAKMKLKNTWECSEGITVKFSDDDVIETTTSFLGTDIKVSGTYSINKTELSEQNKKLTKDGYYYFNIKGKFTKQSYLAQTEDYDEDFELAFGIKKDEAHLIVDGESVICKKK